MKEVTIPVPAVTSGIGSILQLKFILGDDSSGAVWLHGLQEVSQQNRQSIWTAKSMAEAIIHRPIDKSITIELQEPHHDIGGRSWEVSLTIGFLSLMLNTPIKAGTIATGRIRPDGVIEPVSSYLQKILASMNAGFTTFLMPFEYDISDREQVIAGMKFIPVKNLEQAWSVSVTGYIKPWLVEPRAIAKDMRCYY